MMSVDFGVARGSQIARSVSSRSRRAQSAWPATGLRGVRAMARSVRRSMAGSQNSLALALVGLPAAKKRQPSRAMKFDAEGQAALQVPAITCAWLRELLV